MAQFPDEQTKTGSFKRQDDAFRDWVKRDGSSPYKPEPGRYHLYVSLACPWAHRTIIMRRLKGLEAAIGMTVVDPVRDERGWAFRNGPGHSEDPINGFQFLSEAYLGTDPGYHGRVTVPVLWDTKTKRIVSNSDDDLLRMFNSEFAEFVTNDYDFAPADLLEQIDIIKPKVVVALGAVAVEGLLGTRAPMRELRGRWDSFNGTPLMITYHPAYLLRNQTASEKRKVWEDMLQVLERLERPITERQRNYFL